MGLLQGLFLSHRPSSFLFSSFTLLLLSLLSTVQAVGSTVLPSNNSAELSWSEKVRYHLESTQLDLPRAIDLAPLTRSLVNLNNTRPRDLNRSGILVQVDASNSVSLQDTDIAFITCDPSAYTGNLDASATVNYALNSQQQPSAILLYSTTASHCNYTDEGNHDYIYLFTTLNADSAQTLETQLRSSNRTGSSKIVPNMSSFAPTGPGASSGDGGSTNSPNTAMIILYSITGIITALFLSIIITGAIRAHRHPERYGPRQRPGRPRQSRARGIARAMLETIPIVKFGDQDDGKLDADKGDVEMSIASEVPASQLREDQTRQLPMATGGATSPTSEEAPRNPATSNTPESNQERRTGTTEAETPTEHPNFSCPICTDDFVKGQDLRVLPCNHQFHPECIDPWLVNVSGTCPLCRIDLNPPRAEGENATENAENNTETQQQEQQDEATDRPAEGTTHRHRRLSNYLHGTLNARRMRDASVEERLAALRSVREEANREQDDETDEQRRRRHRFSARVRERFRIRTRAHGDDSSPSN